MSKVKELSGREYKILSTATLVEKEGVSGLVGFLKAVYEHVRKEVCVVTVFDGDEAGVRARRELQGFFSRRGEFRSNREFVSVRSGFPMEGLFADVWMKECQSEFPAWFKDWSEDASGAVEPFDIRDESKEAYAKYMCKRVSEQNNLDDLGLLVGFYDALESALETSGAGLKAAV